MKVLVLGSGAKDHAITWKFSKSKRLSGLFIAPGNAGTNKLGINLPEIDPSDPQSVLQACHEHKIDIVFAGTESPIASGVVDALIEEGIKTFGATKNAVRLEGDRSFARDFSTRYNIPMPEHAIVSSTTELIEYIEAHPGLRFVIKKNGLAPSRIMLDSADPEALLIFGEELLKEDEILIEEHLKGMPLTLSVLTDGENYLMLPISSEYTKAEEQDQGAATGGMGSICPVPVLGRENNRRIIENIVKPALLGMKEEELSYKGILIFSLILTNEGPKLVDYHVRFNDPATQAMLPLINSDFIDMSEALLAGTIADFNLKVSNQSAVAIVIASEGYPSHPVTEKAITLSPLVSCNMVIDNSISFYGAVEQYRDKLLTKGGRCFTVVGLGTNIIEANSSAYAALQDISFEGAWSRSDIGNKFFNE